MLLFSFFELRDLYRLVNHIIDSLWEYHHKLPVHEYMLYLKHLGFSMQCVKHQINP